MTLPQRSSSDRLDARQHRRQVREHHGYLAADRIGDSG